MWLVGDVADESQWGSTLSSTESFHSLSQLAQLNHVDLDRAVNKVFYHWCEAVGPAVFFLSMGNCSQLLVISKAGWKSQIPVIQLSLLLKSPGPRLPCVRSKTPVELWCDEDFIFAPVEWGPGRSLIPFLMWKPAKCTNPLWKIYSHKAAMWCFF